MFEKLFQVVAGHLQ